VKKRKIAGEGRIKRGIGNSDGFKVCVKRNA
jgi:hypothetical protein